MNRQNCVICNSKLISFYTRENFPICFYHTTEPYTTDIFADQNIGECEVCGCIQQMHLFDPEVLYKYSHNQTYNTPTWKNHHTEFLEFIFKNTSSKNIFDIGGNPDIYAHRMIDKNYKILNICPPENNAYEHLFEVGNCETYIFNPEFDIIMSHVFEHLYEPRKFVENARKCNVKRIFISIPNMDYILKTNAPFVLHSEHTYFVNSELLKFLFNSFDYICKDFKEFKNHSYFYYFELSNDPITVTMPRISIRSEFVDGITSINSRIMKYSKNNYDFIIPAGNLGQYIHYCLKSDIIGFIDNDKSKHKRLYGTTLSAYPFNELTKYNRKLNILLYGSIYSKELYDQIIATIGDNAIIDII